MTMRRHQAFETNKLLLFLTIHLQFFTMSLAKVLQLRLMTLHHFQQLQINRKAVWIVYNRHFFALKAYHPVSAILPSYARMTESVPASDEHSRQTATALLVAVVTAASRATELVHVI